MKQLTMLIMVVVFWLGLSAPAVAQSTAEPIINGGFEAG
jgi:hypothetical protein